MLRNYLKIAWRQFARHKAYTTINIVGLTLGICACMIIYFVTRHELSFDNFHPDKERIYRVMSDVTESTGDKLHFARTPLALSTEARSQLPESVVMGAVIPWNATIGIPDGDNTLRHFESQLPGTHFTSTVIAQPQYFTIFPYTWLAGNAVTSLEQPFALVLTESRARGYFGSLALDEMIGRKVVYADSLVATVSGIIKDWDGNTDLAFTDFISFNTVGNNFLKKNISTGGWDQKALTAWTFIKLDQGIAPDKINARMNALVKEHAGTQQRLALWLEPLQRIHFNFDIIENPIRTAHMPTLYTLAGIALFILILAIINFVNLSTAQSVWRAKETGVRKVLGGSTAGLRWQFLTETFLLTFVSVLIAGCLVKPLSGLFKHFLPEGISFNILEPSTILFLLCITIITSLLAGFYPAKILSSYLPVSVLNGTGSQKGSAGWLLRKGLIVFQFSVSLVFITGSIVMARQLSYTREKDHGFNADAIITIEAPRDSKPASVRVLAEKIKQIPSVDKCALQWLSPMTENARGMKLKFKSTDEKDFWVTQVAGDENFIPLYEIKLLAGRNLVKSDSVNEFVINESLCRLMGNKNPADCLNKALYWNDKLYPIVGVVADFHTSSLHDPVTPLCIINRPDREGAIAIKLNSKGKQLDMVGMAISEISKAWKQIYPGATFSYRFYDESLALLYEKDRHNATLMNISTAITIFISCMGLLGLSLFTAQRRAKEISIRKIVGAGVSNIVVLLGKDFLIPVVIAFFIASPVAWYFMSQWLQGFAYHINISAWIFILAGMATLTIAVITVGFQAVKAAVVNPVKNLRSN
jgi:putative ABC transport system permease protein